MIFLGSLHFFQYRQFKDSCEAFSSCNAINTPLLYDALF